MVLDFVSLLSFFSTFGLIVFLEDKHLQLKKSANLLALIERKTLFWCLSLALLPGTFLHESAHYIVGLLTFGKPGKFSVFPKEKDGQYGFVGFRNIQIYNVVPIAIAPLLLAIPAYLCILKASPVSNPWLSGAASAVLFHASIPSNMDLKAIKTQALRLAIHLLWIILTTALTALLFYRNHL